MKLVALLSAIEVSPGAVTVGDLAQRLATTPAAVAAMLDALRAAGRLGPEGPNLPGTHACASTGSCGLTCPDATDCPFTIEFGTSLEIRRR